MVDLSVYSKVKGFGDYMRENEALQLERQLAAAKIQEALQKQNYLDVDKLGEQSLYKAAQGLELTPQEMAAARFVNAKTGGIQFDPTTGNMIQKQNLSTQLGVDLGVTPVTPAPQVTPLTPQPVKSPGFMPEPPQLDEPPIDAKEPNKNDFDIEFDKAYQEAAGNPKMQQQLKTDYLKSKFDVNESQTKSAGFADRALTSHRILNDPNLSRALQNPADKAMDLPYVGNYLNSTDYQLGTQAQRDFINAILRRESGAVISPGEFLNAEKQYFPLPGEDAKVLTQKAANRENTIKGLQRSAGSGYIIPKAAIIPDSSVPKLQNPNIKKPKIGDIITAPDGRRGVYTKNGVRLLK